MISPTQAQNFLIEFFGNNAPSVNDIWDGNTNEIINHIHSLSSERKDISKKTIFILIKWLKSIG